MTVSRIREEAAGKIRKKRYIYIQKIVRGCDFVLFGREE